MTPFARNGLSGTLVGVPGLPGAVLGWNTAGLAAFVGLGASTDLPLGEIVPQIVGNCRSLAEASHLLAKTPLAPRGIVVATAE